VPVHFSDVAKFRQRYSQWQNPEEDMDAAMWRTSVECLADEFEYLQAVPKQVIVVKWVKDFFKPEATLNRSGELRRRWRDDPKDVRLDRVLEVIEQARDLNDHHVSGWKSRTFRGEMERALAATPAHDPNQYDPTA
jgi:hypothetical protein